MLEAGEQAGADMNMTAPKGLLPARPLCFGRLVRTNYCWDCCPYADIDIGDEIIPGQCTGAWRGMQISQDVLSVAFYTSEVSRLEQEVEALKDENGRLWEVMKQTCGRALETGVCKADFCMDCVVSEIPIVNRETVKTELIRELVALFEQEVTFHSENGGKSGKGENWESGFVAGLKLLVDFLERAAETL